MNAVETGWNSLPEATREIFGRLEQADEPGRSAILKEMPRDDLSTVLREVACARRMELGKRVDAPMSEGFPIRTIESVLRSMRAHL
ncbi:hypothetical protein HOG48_06190 [Candidatus Peregrinibacteria bacterium]|jgi:hypothetical protein|nr:hypothetical protein [Candidatus Peregrinibacteria bacterium]